MAPKGTDRTSPGLALVCRRVSWAGDRALRARTSARRPSDGRAGAVVQRTPGFVVKMLKIDQGLILTSPEGAVARRCAEGG